MPLDYNETPPPVTEAAKLLWWASKGLNSRYASSVTRQSHASVRPFCVEVLESCGHCDVLLHRNTGRQGTIPRTFYRLGRYTWGIVGMGVRTSKERNVFEIGDTVSLITKTPAK